MTSGRRPSCRGQSPQRPAPAARGSRPRDHRQEECRSGGDERERLLDGKTQERRCSRRRAGPLGPDGSREGNRQECEAHGVDTDQYGIGVQLYEGATVKDLRGGQRAEPESRRQAIARRARDEGIARNDQERPARTNQEPQELDREV